MTLTIELSDVQASRPEAQAEAQGLSVETLASENR